MRHLLIDGRFNTFDDWGLVLSEKTLNPPAPKYYKVDVPGADGDINITQALTGNTVYENREQEFVFTLMYPTWSFEKLKTEISNLIHGQEFDYELSWDKGYTYHGWFTVDKYETDGILNRITITVDANPYKSKGTKTEVFDIEKGMTAYLSSGRKPVRPVFEFSGDTVVTFEGKRYVMPPGTYTINDIWFKQGTNEVTFVNQNALSCITWGELKRYTWGEFGAKPLYEWYIGVQKYAVSKILLEGTETPITGTVSFTIADADGNTKTSSVDLGDMFIGRVGEEFDTLTVIDDVAYLKKVVKLNDDGSYGLLELPESYTFRFDQLYFNDSEVASLTCNVNGNLFYESEGFNIERTVEQTTWADYMEGGRLAMTWGEAKAYTWAQLRQTVFENVEGTEVPVVDDPRETVYVQYEWLDL